MVRLDGDAWAVHTHGLNDVGVNRALAEEFNALNSVCFAVKNFDKRAADGLALGFGVFLAG